MVEPWGFKALALRIEGMIMEKNTSGDDLSELPEDQQAKLSRLMADNLEVRVVAASELEELKADSRKLAALEAAGVDNWSGYDYAMQLKREWENEK